MNESGGLNDWLLFPFLVFPILCVRVPDLASPYLVFVQRFSTLGSSLTCTVNQATLSKVNQYCLEIKVQL